MTGSDSRKVKEDRAERLSAALRANLRRRKAQAKGRKAEEERHDEPDRQPRSHDSAGFVEDK